MKTKRMFLVRITLHCCTRRLRCYSAMVTAQEFQVNQYEEIMAHVATLESHVARLEGIIHVMLEQIEAGTIQQVAAQIRAELPRIEPD